MVVFTCNACGEPLKKNQVEKHYLTQCRRCEVLSCVDCGKDFWGDEYQKHIKCISEEEKYSGKNFVPKPNANKGEVKQEQWIQQVQVAVEKSKSNPKLRNTLERIQDYPNIPRKKSKFENFMKNSLNVRDSQVVSQVWDLLMVNIDKKMEAEKLTSETNGTEGQQQNEELPAKLNKRERKEERRKNMNKKEKKDRSNPETDSGVNGDGEIHQKKTKKRKHEETESNSQTLEENKGSDGLEEQQQQSEGAKLSKKEGRKKKKNRSVPETESSCLMGDSEIHQKKKKRKHEEIENDSPSQEETENSIDQGDAENENEEERPGKLSRKRAKVVFNWEDVITEVLKSKGEEISIKKLKKKVLAEYLFRGGSNKSEEKLWAKFDKKLTKNPKFKVLKDRVKLSER
ncbi:hypothetical protein ACJMK2_006933 [Sinanodonta woodiana]|uniref:Cell growth-regulating nucleolar protein n=1 Tax=Sinanodonta woodiana TaxID=1069815 RepID=A0ABD3VUP3_SINWO